MDRFSKIPFPLLVGVVALLLNFWMALCFPIIDDEAYYWNWSQSLDWGYFDHPPLVAWIIAFGDLFGVNAFGLRCLNCVLGAIGFFLITQITNPSTTKEKLLWVILLFSNVLLALYGFITTPDGALIFFVILYLWVLYKKPMLNRWRFILLVALASAGLLYSKYHGVLVIGFSVLPFLRKIQKEGAWLLGLVLGGLLYIPHLIWQYNHDWVSFIYHLSGRDQHDGFTLRYAAEFVLNFLWAGSPLLIPFILFSFYTSNWKTRMNSIYVSIILGVFGLFLFSSLSRSTQPQWIVLIFPILSIMGFHYYKSHVNTKWVFRLGVTNLILLFTVRIIMSFPSPIFLTPFHGTKVFMNSAAKISDIAVWEKYQTTALYNFHNYPKKGINYATVGNRESQFDLWEDPTKMEGESIRYFSKYAAHWNDSLIWENAKRTPYYHKKIDSVVSLPSLRINVINRIQGNDSTQIYLQLKNTSETKTIHYPANKKLSFVVRYMRSRHEALYSQNLVLPEFKLNPKAKLEVKTRYKEWDSSGVFRAYIGTKPLSLPDRKKSDWLEFEVK